MPPVLAALRAVVVAVAASALGADGQAPSEQQQLTLADAHWESSCTIAEWASRAAAVEATCCPRAQPPIGSGHRRSQVGAARDRDIDAAIAAADCALPTACPSQGCAEVFVPFRYQCASFVDTVAAQNGQLREYDQLLASCEAMLLQADGVPYCDHERVVCDEQADCHVECATDDDEVEAATCEHLLVAADIVWFNDLVASHPVVFFGTRHDSETSAAGRLFYEQSVCTADEILDNGLGMYSLLRYLRCLYPHEDILGTSATSFVFVGGTYFGNGLAVAGVDARELEARLERAGAARTCGVTAAQAEEQG